MSNYSTDENMFEQAVQSAQHGDMINGYRLMRQVLLAAPDYAPAWFWMSRLVQDPRRKRECLERALALDPSLRQVRDVLESLNDHQESTAYRHGSFEPQKLGFYLIQRGLITEQQLELALAEQRGAQSWGKRLPLGDILIRRGLITAQELAKALIQQQCDKLRSGSGRRPERLGEYLVANKLITNEQLADLLAEQAQLRQRGHYIVLGELLIRGNYISFEALERTLERQRRDFFGMSDN
jgi:hypothetical protein